MAIAGEIIANRYLVLKLLGEGGMGQVYQVQDQIQQRECALKILSNKIASEEAFLQFKQEFWFMTKLHHPHIIHVFEYGVLDDQSPYITMELVPGQELSQVVKPDYPIIYNVLIQAAKALGFIHSRLLVHCDIKPDNIRVGQTGELKLMDFGLMRPLGNRSNGQLSGTVAYMPPEMPQRGMINESSDLYSLGVLGYEMITGVQPFIGKTILDIIKAHIHNPPPPLHSFRKDIPPALEAIILKLMAKNQDERYQNASELLADLAKASNRKDIAESLEEKKSYLSSHVLVGRDTELNTLKGMLDKVKQGRTQAVFVGAPAGVGKSRLIEEFKIHSQLAEIPFCEGICIAQGMTSYEPLVKALSKVIPLTPEGYFESTGPILAYLLPQLLEKGIKLLPGFDPKTAKLQLFEQVVRWLQQVAQKTPLVLFIDDLHWSDLATIDLFNYCVRELDPARVLLMGSFRDDELLPNNPLWQTIDEKAATLLKLHPFNDRQVAELVQRMLVHVELKPDFISYFYGATSGNAFFITEIMRYLLEEDLIKRQGQLWVIPDNFSQWELPTSIGDTVKHRLKRLSSQALHLIHMAAVVGRRIPLQLLEGLGQLTEDALFTTLEELVERQFLLRDDPCFIFPHDRVRETLYADLGETTRRPLHQQIGEWLEVRQENPTTLAYHFKNGLDKTKAVNYLFLAGDLSSVRMESSRLFKEGLGILENLPDFPDQTERLRSQRSKLAWISYMIDPWICSDTCEKLIADMSLENEPLDNMVEYESLLISSYTMVGQNEKALKRAEILLKQLEVGSLPYALILFGRLNALLTRGELRQLVHEMEEVVLILKPRLPSLSRQMLWAYAFCCFIREDAIAWLGEPVGNNHYAEVPRMLGHTHNFLDLVFWSYYPEVVRNSLIGNYHKIKSVQDEIFTMIKKMGRPIQHENRFNVCLAFAAIEHGELQEGSILAEKIVTLGQQMKNPHQQSNGKILQGMIACQQGQYDEAELYLSEAVELSRKSQTDQLIPALYRLAEVHIQRSEWPRAELLIEEAHALATSRKLENPYHQILTYRLKGQLAVYQEIPENKIMTFFLKSIDIAEQTGNTMQTALSHWLLAEHLIQTQQQEPILRHLDSAVQAFETLLHPLRHKVSQMREQFLSGQEKSKHTVAASMLSSLPDLSVHSPLKPDQAQALGYRMLELLKEFNLSPSQTEQASNNDFNVLSERLEKSERVNQFSQLIMKSLDLRIALNNILDYVIDISQADRGFMMLLDVQGKELSLQVARHAHEEQADEKAMMNFSKTFTQKVIESGQSLWVRDAQADDRFARQASIMALDLRTIICVPLKKDKEMIGLLYLDRQAINKTFTEADLNLVESMAAFATISLVNARLHHDLEERSERLQMLNELSRAVSSTVEFSELLDMVLSFCLSISQAENGYILMTKALGHNEIQFSDLDCQSSRNRAGKPLKEVLVSQSIIQKVLRSREPMCVMDTLEDETLATQQSIMALDLRSVMCVPIHGKQQDLLGVVYVSSEAVNYCFTPRDLALIESIIRQVGLAIENRHLLEIRKKQELLDHELLLARNIQTSMLPDYIPDIESLDIIGYSESAAAVGGDYYDYFKISDAEFGMAIGDVNGHGVSAGLLMAMAKSCLFVQGKIDPRVLPVMNALNSMVYGGTKERLFMTFIYSIFDIQDQTVTLASAGHHLPYHYSHALKTLQPIQVKATYPLGVREKSRFNEVTVQLAPNDVLVYYTDGFIEAHNPAGEEFGFDRFEQLIVQHAQLSSLELKEMLLRHYKDWVGDQEAEDDITVVVVRIKPSKPSSEQDGRKLKTGFLTLINR